MNLTSNSKHLAVLAMIMSVALASCSKVSGPQVFTNSDGTCTVLEFYSDNILRVSAYPDAGHMKADTERPDKDWSICMSPGKVNASIRKGSDGTVYSSKNMEVEVRPDGSLEFRHIAGNGEPEKLMSAGDRQFVPKTGYADSLSFEVTQVFHFDEDEPLYGLGYDQSGLMSLRGHTRNLEQLNEEDAIPFLMSVKGYGILWNSSSETLFTDNAGGTSLKSEVAESADYFVLYGENPAKGLSSTENGAALQEANADGVIAQLRELTGHVPMLPLWSYGFWQSRERNQTQEELLDVLAKYRELEIPLDGIIQDWRYWGEYVDWNAMKFLDPGFHDPKAMVDEVHKNNAHIIISVWPSFGRNTDIYAELAEGGHVYPQYTWPPEANVYDAFSDEANEIFWKYLKEMFDLGFDGWWLDASEPEIWNGESSQKDFVTAAGTLRRVKNAYPFFEIGNVYKNQREVAPDKRVFILTRSVFTGQQRYAAHTWTGDTDASWNTLRNQVAAGLNFTLSGNPNFNCDLGAFTAGNYNLDGKYGTAPQNRNYRELYVRWVQFGAFTSMMRSHGTDTPREFYYFGQKGEPVFDALVDAVKLRYSLLPYIYSASWEITAADGSLMRPLIMDFAKDRNTWDMGSEYMFGRSILVAPVLKAQFTSEEFRGEGKFDAEVDFSGKHPYEVYLPAGAGWYDYKTGQFYDGGQTITVQTGIDDIPMFARAGSIIPIGPDVQWSGEKDWHDLTFNIYPGENASFTLYEDSGDGYAYENNEYSCIDFQWDDQSGTISVSDRSGDYPGMLEDRQFTFSLAGGGEAVIQYDGKKTSAKLQ